MRVPRGIGLSAVQILGARCGTAIDDGVGGVYFLVPPGVSIAGADPADPASAPIPAGRRTSGPGPRWLVCPAETWLPTDPDALAAALADALPHPSALTGEQVRGAACVWCEKPVQAGLNDVDLGSRRWRPSGGASVAWFPRTCRACYYAKESR
ncbi:hypothetical protein [Streptomyces sp. NPDC001054]